MSEILSAQVCFLMYTDMHFLCFILFHFIFLFLNSSSFPPFHGLDIDFHSPKDDVETE